MVQFATSSAPAPSRTSLDRIDRAIGQLAELRAGLDEPGSYVAYHRLRLAEDLDLVEAHRGPVETLVEVGSTPPILTLALRERFPALVGLDIAPEKIHRLIETFGLDIRRCNVETDTLPLDDGSVDMVLFNEVFEHLRIDLVFTFSEVMRVLKPGGTLMLSTPNLRSLRGIKALLIDGRGAWCMPHLHENWSHVGRTGAMGHVREYTPRDVVEFLTHMGFRCERVVYRGRSNRTPARALVRLVPSLRPFFSVIARRPAETG